MNNDHTNDGAPRPATPRSSVACSNAHCTDPSHGHPPRPAAAPTVAQIDVTISVQADLKDPTMTEARFLTSVNEKIPELRQTLLNEFRRLKAGGTPTVSEVS